MTTRPTGARLSASMAAVACSALLLTGCLPESSEDSSAQDAPSAQDSASAEETATAESSATTDDSASAESSPSESSPSGGASTGAEQPADAEQAADQGYALNTEGEDLPVVTMYTDYECPACGSFHPAVEQAAQELDGEVTLRVKNFPLPMHDNARPAALAVEAAAMQGAGQEYADLVYGDVDEWSELSDDELTDRFVELAGEAELDQEQFRQDMGSEDVAHVVDEHEQQAEDLGLQGTPSFVVDEHAIDLGDIRTPEDLRDVLEDAAEDSGSAEDGTRT